MAGEMNRGRLAKRDLPKRDQKVALQTDRFKLVFKPQKTLVSGGAVQSKISANFHATLTKAHKIIDIFLELRIGKSSKECIQGKQMIPHDQSDNLQGRPLLFRSIASAVQLKPW